MQKVPLHRSHTYTPSKSASRATWKVKLVKITILCQYIRNANLCETVGYTLLNSHYSASQERQLFYSLRRLIQIFNIYTDIGISANTRNHSRKKKYDNILSQQDVRQLQGFVYQLQTIDTDRYGNHWLYYVNLFSGKTSAFLMGIC